jgi:hypothetical protein
MRGISVWIGRVPTRMKREWDPVSQDEHGTKTMLISLWNNMSAEERKAKESGGAKARLVPRTSRIPCGVLCTLRYSPGHHLPIKAENDALSLRTAEFLHCIFESTL